MYVNAVEWPALARKPSSHTAAREASGFSNGGNVPMDPMHLQLAIGIGTARYLGIEGCLGGICQPSPAGLEA